MRVELSANATGVRPGLGVLDAGYPASHGDEGGDFCAHAGVVPQVAMVVGDISPHVQEPLEVWIQIGVVEPLDMRTERLERSRRLFDGPPCLEMNKLEIGAGEPDPQPRDRIRHGGGGLR